MSKAIAFKSFSELQQFDIVFEGEILSFGIDREFARDLIIRNFAGNVFASSHSKNAQRIAIYAELQKYSIIEIAE